VGTSPQLVPVAPDPRGNCGAACGELRDALAAIWLDLQAGDRISEGPEEVDIGGEAYLHLSDMARAYADFGQAAAASPIAGYVSLLSAAQLRLVPFADQEGEAIGVVPLNQ
jgi:hypothetical protein